MKNPVRTENPENRIVKWQTGVACKDPKQVEKSSSLFDMLFPFSGIKLNKNLENDEDKKFFCAQVAIIGSVAYEISSHFGN